MKLSIKLCKYGKKLRLRTPVAALILLGFWCANEARSEDIKVKCPKGDFPYQKLAVDEVYKGKPYQAGEKAVYKVSYGVAPVGHATLSVKKPVRWNKVYHQNFEVTARTGSWYEVIFVARERMIAFSRPDNFAISRFYIKQKEKAAFKRAFEQEKWLNFDQVGCKVHERILKPGKPEKKETLDLHRGAIDALSVIYQLRTRTFKIGVKERAPVYTSQKNWWLEAHPVAHETLKTDAGTFKTVKLKLVTFLGKDLQQKGDVFAWVATNTPERQLVRLQGDVKIGSVDVMLAKYTPGKPLKRN